MKKRIISSIVAIMMLVTAAACADNDGNNDDTDEGSAQETEAEFNSEEYRLNFSSDLGKLNYDGEEFHILGLRDVNDFTLEEVEPAGRMESALFRRDRTIEEKLNVDLVYDGLAYDQLESAFELSVAANEGYELYLGQVLRLGNEVLNGYCLNWKNLANVNFSKPWYTDNTVNALTLNDRLYICIGAMNMSDLGYTNCMYFNKNLVETYHLGDIYGIVNDKKWTYDYMYGLVKDIYEDRNQNNKADEGDLYGLSFRSGDIPVFMWAFNQKIVTFDSDGGFDITFNSEKTESIIEKLDKLLYNTTGVSNECAAQNDYKGIGIFAAENSVFAFGYVSQTLSYLANNEDYGIIPYPMYDEAQGEYFTMVDGSATGMVVPIYVPDTDYVSAVIEELNCETWRTCELEYYDKALKTRGTRDEESVAMLDMIFESRVTDVQYVHDAWKGYAFALEVICQRDSTTGLAKYCASKDKAVVKHYQEISDFYFGN